LAGNVWEHVNGANTMSVDNIDMMNTNACGVAENEGWHGYSFHYNDGAVPCTFSN